MRAGRPGRALFGAVLAGWAWGAAGALAAPPAFEEFAARRIGVPAAGARRITVQIDPAEQARRMAPPPKPAPSAGGPPGEDAGTGAGAAAPPPAPRYAAFWARVSPRLSDLDPGRLRELIAALDGDGAPPAPRIDDLRRITDRYGRDILRLTVGTGVSPALVAAVISVESSGRQEAVSHAGATGLMQLMPATAARFAVDAAVPADNLKGGIAYLDWLLREFGGDPVFALAGYNAGENAVKRHQGVPPYAETMDYVPKVLAAYRVAAGLCRTPPLLISDGCVFVGPGA